MQFRTHTGEIVEGPRLDQALHAVADAWVNVAKAIFADDEYASHVTLAEKISYLQEDLAQAERIRTGTEKMGFWLWQRINAKLTGECVPFLAQ